MSDFPAAHYGYDSLAAAALDAGFEPDEIAIGDYDGEIHLQLYRDGQEGFVRFTKAGLSRKARVREGQVQHAVLMACAAFPDVGPDPDQEVEVPGPGGSQ